MEHEILSSHALLDEKGRLIEPGFTRGLLMDYDRKKIKAGALRIKEWDYYLITTKDFAVALTIDDNSYMGLDSISLLNFKEGWEHTTSPMKFFTMGKRCFPSRSDEGDIEVKYDDYEISFKLRDGKRILKFMMKNFYDKKPIVGEIELDNPKEDSMVICTPWKEKDTAFYYNQKIVAMPAKGFTRFDGVEYTFEEGKSFGLLDWGRGVWTYKNAWYWGAAQGMVGKDRIGWNIGYGFGDTKNASENMLFVNGKAHKLDRLTFNIPLDEKGNEKYLEDWTFTSNDKRFEMKFHPIMDRASKTDFKVLGSDQHQVFGFFTGTVVTDEGEEIKVKDFLGFAEKVYNKW